MSNQVRGMTLSILIAIIGIGIWGSSFAQDPLSKRISANFKNLEISQALSIIASQADLREEVAISEEIKVTFRKSRVRVREVLETFVRDYGIHYELDGKVLLVTGGKGRSPAMMSGDIRKIKLNFVDAQEMKVKLLDVLSKEEKVVVDKPSNSLIFVGSKAGYEKAVSFVRFFDDIPKQILIEAQIVETTHNFLRNIGFQYGNVNDQSVGGGRRYSTVISTPGPESSNFIFNYMMGSIKGNILELNLAAAETNGDAKVISRPKVVTLNNTPATVTSGITFSVKTLSAVESGSGAGTFSGGIQSVSAGLSLAITPTITADNLVKMVVNINNSTPDEGSAVDGIPGVINNAANTEVIVQDRKTAVIAGLIKKATAETHNGVPFLSSLPILGYLFRSHSESKRNNELVIFITPTILHDPRNPGGGTQNANRVVPLHPKTRSSLRNPASLGNRPAAFKRTPTIKVDEEDLSKDIILDGQSGLLKKWPLGAHPKK